jgi:serine/threonine-protein kinase RCK2
MAGLLYCLTHNLLAKDLIRNLLCVDPAQRYTIDEFLAHPWCHAAPAPPPPPTPYIYNNQVYSTMPLDSPLLSAARGGRVEGRSPGLAILKEAFDVTYNIHRMEEEGARRRRFKGAGARGFLQGLNEDEEDEDEVATAKSAGVADNAAQYNDRKGNLSAGITGTPKQKHATKNFELDIDGATLLGRRHKRVGDGVGTVSSPLSGKPAGSPMNARASRLLSDESPALDPGSPMRM